MTATGPFEDTDGPITWSGEERRRLIEMSEAEWRTLIVQRLGRQDKMLKRIDDAMQYFAAAKVGLGALKWLAGLGLAVTTIWAAFHGGIRL